MKIVQLLQATNTISQHKHQFQQDLVFVMLIENVAYHKLVEVHWAGKDRVWHKLRADYHSFTGTNREIWRAQATFHASNDASLPGDVEFALRYCVLGEEYWDNNESHNYFSNCDSGVLLEQSSRGKLDVPALQVGCPRRASLVSVREIYFGAVNGISGFGGVQAAKVPEVISASDPHSPFPAQRGLLVQQAQSQVEIFVYLHNPRVKSSYCQA